MGVKLAAASGGSIELVPTNTASAFTVTVPAVTATALTDSAGILNIGSGQIYKDASGNVGIGTSSPAARLDLQGSVGTSTPLLILRNNSAANASNIVQAQFFAGNTFGGLEQIASIAALNPNAGGNNGGALVFSTSANGTATTPTERARIDSSGNLQVGCTTNPQAVKLSMQYGGTNIWGVGPNSGSATFYVINSAGTGVYLSTGAISWAAVSDERIKNIVEPIENATQKLSTWRTVIGKYKTDEEGVRRSFLIAQDVLATFPEAVDTTDAEKYGIRYQETIPLLVAAIQEQQALIVQLQADVAALKGAQA